MRAVNLIPADRRRSSGGIGRSGGAVYVILGALGGLLILATLYAVASHQVADRKAQAVKDTQESASATARASQLAPYKQFSDLRNQSEQSVVNLASTRFDWPTLMRNIASSLPAGVVLSTFEGTPAGTSTGAPAPAPAAGTAGAAGSGGGPSIHMVGCATSHTQVGDVINRLRGVPGVLTVVFSSSTKASSGGTGPAPAGGSAGGGACGPGGPQFDLTVSVSASGATPSSSSATAKSSTQAGAVAPATGTPAPAVGSHP